MFKHLCFFYLFWFFLNILLDYCIFSSTQLKCDTKLETFIVVFYFLFSIIRACRIFEWRVVVSKIAYKLDCVGDIRIVQKIDYKFQKQFWRMISILINIAVFHDDKRRVWTTLAKNQYYNYTSVLHRSEVVYCTGCASP